MMFRQNIFTIALLVLVFRLDGQSYRNDMVAIYNNMRSATSYSMQIEYKLYVDKKLRNTGVSTPENSTPENIPYQQRTVEVKRQKNSVLLRQNTGIEVLYSENHNFFVDNNKKKLVVQKNKNSSAKPEEVKAVNEFMSENIDTLLTVFEKINVLADTKNSVTYECIYKPNSTVTKKIVTINKKLKVFESVVTEYSEPVEIKELDNKKHTITMVVQYKNFRVNVPFGPEVFSSANYVMVDKAGNTKPNNKYSKYEFTLSK